MLLGVVLELGDRHLGEVDLGLRGLLLLLGLCLGRLGCLLGLCRLRCLGGLAGLGRCFGLGGLLGRLVSL